MIDYSKIPDMTKPQKGGGGDYKPPAAGAAMLRLVGYVEIGEHEKNFKGQVVTKPMVQLVFELHGKNYPVTDHGPVRMTITETFSMHEKSNLYKMFMTMRNGDNTIKHMSQLVGRAFKGKVEHTTSKSGKTYANLINITPPIVEDPETGGTRTLAVPEAVSEPRIFLWNYATKEQWDNLYIEGRNVFQEKIKSALNYEGSAAQAIAEGKATLMQDVFKSDEPKNIKQQIAAETKPSGRFKREAAPVEKTDKDPFSDKEFWGE